MIIKTGIDIVNVNRLQNIFESKGQKLIDRILTNNEQTACINKGVININKVAKRFAAKEAFSKCLGTGIGEISFLDIEVLNDDCGAPYINISNKTKNYINIIKKWHNYKIEVSLSDDKDMAIAMVLVYSM